MRSPLRRWTFTLLLLAVAAGAVLLVAGYARRHPEDVPWTKLDLTRPIGAFTGRKLAAFGSDPAQCHDLLQAAGVRHRVLPPRNAGPQCSYRQAVRFAPGGARNIAYRPGDLATSCPVAAALALWEWHVVQPAALRHFGAPVEQIDHLGSYSCRRINNRADGGWSEHATANAVDIAGFRMAGGREVRVERDWNAAGAPAAFLRDVRDGACDLFATVLSPDFNEAHRDHLHLDQAARGASSWRACR